MEFGPMHLWESMGFIAKAVVIVLFLQSIYSLYVTIERWMFFKKAKKQSLEFAKQLLAKAKVSVSPGIGFGDHGDDHVRFALIENESRIRQAVRGIKAMFRADGVVQGVATAAANPSNAA